ncbi:MAG TPA: bifunctional riboflavin kinase/FAD synthetase [Ignavibacteria bacterium]|nr:bifunctional riboflavin kinase/FAD synthetase [Ignavibacteria bacterium]
MKIVKDLNEIVHNRNSAVTVGTFDGVHLGHREIIRKLNAVKESNDLRSVIVTFDPHPQIVLRNRDREIKILSTLKEKLEIFRELNIDLVYVISFTKEFSLTPAERFYKEYLIDGIGMKDLILGYDHMFGKNREGNFETLKDLSEKFEFKVDKVDEYKPDGDHISSTVIRHLLEEGNVEKASGLLGRFYSLEGTIVKGKKLGREIGYPTANIRLDDEFKLIPKTGIYATEVILGTEKFYGMMNIGTNPTVTDDKSIKIEVNIFDFDKDIYGEEIRVNLTDYIREEKKFKSLEELMENISGDKKKILKLKNNSKINQ